MQSSEITLIPDLGMTYYDNAKAKSLKYAKSYFSLYSRFAGSKKSIDFVYKYSKTAYKENVKIDDYTQHDITFRYTKDTENIFFQTGLHTIISNEATSSRDLGSGCVGFVTLGRKVISDKNRFDYGVELYTSLYFQAHTLHSKNKLKSLFVEQLTPYVKYSSYYNDTIRNDLTLKVNGIYAADYDTPTYLSTEFIDTAVVDNSYFTLRYILGEMRSGVTNEGLEVHNNKNLYNGIYNATLGYFQEKYLAYEMSYTMRIYNEFDPESLTPLNRGASSSFEVSMSYKF